MATSHGGRESSQTNASSLLITRRAIGGLRDEVREHGGYRKGEESVDRADSLGERRLDGGKI